MSVFKEYFNYSKSERRGIFVLVSIIFGLIMYNILIADHTNIYIAEEQLIEERTRNFLKAQEPKLIEVNAADTTAFKSLPGIGSYFASRIIKFRELLGGYYQKEQLLEVYGMDSSRYKKFHKYIRVDTSLIRKININDVEFKELLRHPYLNYTMVKAIFKYKNKVATLASIRELRDKNIISPEKYTQIAPYLRTN